MKLFHFNEKVQVLRNCKKLKGTNTIISNDYSQATLKTRKMLWESAREEEDHGSKVRLDHKALFVDNIRYRWDDSNKCRVRIPGGAVGSHQDV